MSRRLLAVAGAALMLVATAPAVAHRSFAATYDGTKAVRLSGTPAKIEWTNPHSYFYLDVKEDNGQVVQWAAESGGPGALSRRGFKRGDVKLGDTLVVDGYRAKSGARLIDARCVTLPDGRIIYGGTPGDGGPEYSCSEKNKFSSELGYGPGPIRADGTRGYDAPAPLPPPLPRKTAPK
jgi:hypothetical protein